MTSYLDSSFLSSSSSSVVSTANVTNVASAAKAAGTSWFPALHAMGYCSGAIENLVLAIMREDWTGTIGYSANLVGKVGMYSIPKLFADSFKVFKELAKQQEYFIHQSPTAIVDMAFVVVSFMNLFVGIGDPNEGDAFANGSKSNELTALQLDSAMADPASWGGSAANAYNAQTTELQNLVQQAAEIDKRTQEILAEHAAELRSTHTIVVMCAGLLLSAQVVALFLFISGASGPMRSWRFQIFISTAIFATALGAMLKASFRSRALEGKLEHLNSEYASILGSVERNFLSTTSRAPQLSGVTDKVADPFSLSAPLAATSDTQDAPAKQQNSVPGQSSIGDTPAAAQHMKHPSADVHNNIDTHDGVENVATVIAAAAPSSNTAPVGAASTAWPSTRNFATPQPGRVNSFHSTDHDTDHDGATHDSTTYDTEDTFDTEETLQGHYDGAWQGTVFAGAMPTYAATERNMSQGRDAHHNY